MFSIHLKMTCVFFILSIGCGQALADNVDARWQQAPSPTCSTSSTNVVLANAESARTIGVETMQVQARRADRFIERNAVISYNLNRYARLSSRAPGVASEILKDLGEPVKLGDSLAIVDSAELGSAKSDLLLARETATLWQANASRERALVDKGVGVERDALEAETKAAEAKIEVNRARQRLRVLGLSDAHIEQVETAQDASSLLPIVAPFDAQVVERSAVAGEMTESGKPIISIADTSTMWAIVDLQERDLSQVRIGQSAAVQLDALPEQVFEGRVTWISAEVDPRTRTLKARIELKNENGLLRANMFARVRISAGENKQVIMLPKQAVQWEGCCNIAFIKANQTGTEWRPSRLTLGRDLGDQYEVLSGIAPGDEIATRGSYILKNEILKSAIGAGCCEVDHLDK